MGRRIACRQFDIARSIEPLGKGCRPGEGGLGIALCVQHQRRRDSFGQTAQIRGCFIGREPAGQQVPRQRAGEQQPGFFALDHFLCQLGAAVVLRPADQAHQRDRRTELRESGEGLLDAPQLGLRVLQPCRVAAVQARDDKGQHRPRPGKVDQCGEQVFRLRPKRLRQFGVGEQGCQRLVERLVEIAAAGRPHIAIAQHLPPDRIGHLRTPAEVVAQIVVGGDERVEDHTVEPLGRGDCQRAQDQLRAVGDAVEIPARVTAMAVHQQAHVARCIADRESLRALRIGMQSAYAAAPFRTLQRHAAGAVCAFLGRAQPRGQAGPAVIGHDQVEAGRRRAQRVNEGVKGRARFPRSAGDQP